MANEDQIKATIISLFPMPITEHKPGLYPGYFVIPPAPLGDISFLVIGDAVFHTETRNDQVLTVKTAFYTLADSIINDFQQSHIGRVLSEDPEEAAEPGLFWVFGEYNTKQAIKRSFEKEILRAEKRQNNWFKELIKIADDSFARTQRTSSVSQLQRLAAERLAVQRPWVIRTGESKNSCPFCKAEMPFGAVKCPNCREIVNREAYESLVEAQKTPIGQTGHGPIATK